MANLRVSVFSPASSQAADLLWLWHACAWICGLILAIVTVSLVYIVIRYRRRDTRVPSQASGDVRLEIAWTAIPILLVATLFALSIVTARAVDQPVRREPDIIVAGHQWWWEVRYPAANAITANEIHIPVGRNMLLGIEAADVIHDFWVPRLGRKIDAVPGKRNFVWIRAEQPGTYLGACAEYCGPQHAWMRFRVIADQEPAYEAWLMEQAAPATEPGGSDAQLGAMRFRQLTCANCHNITGVNSQKQLAPDLTHISSRKMLGAERLPNTPENLKQWLHEPNVLKPDCLMPNLNLSEQDLTVLTAYLEGLR